MIRLNTIDQIQRLREHTAKAIARKESADSTQFVLRGYRAKQRANATKPVWKQTGVAEFPELVDTKEAAVLLRRSESTLKRWRGESTGPKWHKMERGIVYIVVELLDYVQQNDHE